MKFITVNTVQGIGDIFWVYQKIAPHVDQIHWRIWRVGDDMIQFRSREFVELLPKTASVHFPLVSLPQYQALARSSFPLSEVLKHDAVNYSVNAALEQGQDLYELDPEHEVLDRVRLRRVSEPHLPLDNALCLFVSGSRLDYVWTIDQWASHVATMLRSLNINKVRVIGAEWDEWAANEVTILLQRKGYEVRNFCKQLNLAQTIDCIRSSYYFFGYQSGLSVLAENYNVPQLMVYFPFLRRMMYTWAKPQSRYRQFQAITFDEANAEEMILHAAHPYCLEGRRSAQNV